MEVPVIAKRVLWRGDSGYAPMAVDLNPFSDKYSAKIEDDIHKRFKDSKYGGFVVTVDSLSYDFDPVGKQFICIGEFITHPKYGDQFKAETFYEDIPTTKAGLRMVLKSLPNVKSTRANSIITTFGVNNVIDVLDNDIERLLEISGINQPRLKLIEDAWEKMRGKRNLIIWLGEHNIGGAISGKIYDRWGPDSIDLLLQNPYILTDINRVGFVEADDMAHKILKDVPKPYRTTACIHYLLKEDFRSNGNLCTPYVELKKSVKKLMAEVDEKKGKSHESSEYVNLVAQCIKDNLDKFVAIKDNDNNNQYIYLKEVWEKEKYISKDILKRSSIPPVDDISELDIVDAERDISNISGREIVLDETQKEAIRSAFNNNMTIITGGGGSGKSTICRCIYYLACKKRQSVRLMSPTGKAAQVLGNKTQAQASTIHRSLKIIPGQDHPEEQIKNKIVVIDEFSMVGIDTMYPIIYALENNPDAHIVFVGDCNQLPSVSPGNFLSDITKSKCANVVKLDKIHRQDENSFISLIANEISSGKVVKEIPKNAIDIEWTTATGEQLAAYIAHKMSNYLKDKKIEDIQLIAPMYKGICGITKINEIMQDMMSKIEGSTNRTLKRPFQLFYAGDRVMQWENNYEKEVFNGDMGKIIDLGKEVIDKDKKQTEDDFIVVDFYGEEKIYVGPEIDQLRLAWCCSIHKYQGSQSPYIMLILPYEAQRMMSKELVYTAMTRAEKFLYMIGSIEMFRKAPMYSVVKKRYTNIPKLVQEYRENKKIFSILGA